MWFFDCIFFALKCFSFQGMGHGKLFKTEASNGANQSSLILSMEKTTRGYAKLASF